MTFFMLKGDLNPGIHDDTTTSPHDQTPSTLSSKLQRPHTSMKKNVDDHTMEQTSQP